MPEGVTKPADRALSGCIHARMTTWTPLEFRSATNQDRSGIWSLIASVLAEYRITACEDTTDRDLRDIEQSYWKAGGAFYVLLEGTRVIGTVALHRQSASTCELCRMYLSSAYRGRGLGRRLLDAALKRAKIDGYQEVQLETAAVLTEAVGLYRSAGFHKVARLPSGGNCDLVMTRRVD